MARAATGVVWLHTAAGHHSTAYAYNPHLNAELEHFKPGLVKVDGLQRLAKQRDPIVARNSARYRTQGPERTDSR